MSGYAGPLVGTTTRDVPAGAGGQAPDMSTVAAAGENVATVFDQSDDG